MILLSILIPTIIRRRNTFNKLKLEIERQAIPYGNMVEIIVLEDDCENTIGKKRNELYSLANGKYSVQWDDDDWIDNDAIKLIMDVIHLDVDCITFDEYDLINEHFYKTNYSIKNVYETYNQNGYGHLKPPYPRCAIKTELAKTVKFNEYINYAEDYHWSVQMKHILKTEHHIDKFIYHYSNLANEESNVKQRYSTNNKLI